MEEKQKRLSALPVTMGLWAERIPFQWGLLPAAWRAAVQSGACCGIAVRTGEEIA